MKLIKQKCEDLEKLILNQGDFLNFRLNPPAVAKKISFLAKKYQFPNELITFYEQYNGLKINWFSETSVLCSGSLFIPNIEKLKEYIETPQKTDLKYFAKEIEKGLIPLDVDFINKQVTLIELKESSYEISRINYIGQKTILNITINEYIYLGIKVGGLNHWQNYISKDNYEKFKEYTDDLFIDLIKEKLDKTIANEFYNPSKITNKFTLKDIHKIVFETPKNVNQLINTEYYGCSNHEIRKAELSLKIKLPINFVKWCYANNGAQLKWNIKSFFADFKVLSVEKIFGGTSPSTCNIWNNNYFKDMNATIEFKQLFSNFYSFIFEESGQTVFKIDNDKIELYFISDLTPFKINLSFNSFIEKLKICAGLSGWQYLFTKEYSIENPLIEDLLTNLKEILPPTITIKEFMNH